MKLPVVTWVVLGLAVCMIGGLGMAAVLSSNGMASQDAFNSGMAFALLPVIAVAIVLIVLWWINLIG